MKSCNKNITLKQQQWQQIESLLQVSINTRSKDDIKDLKYYFSDGRTFGGNEQKQKGMTGDSEEEAIIERPSDEQSQIVLNPFQAQASVMVLDLLTDSGTNTYLPQQIQFKDKYINKFPSIEIYAYAGLTPRHHLDKVIGKVFGFQFNFYPTLQGRVAQKLLLNALQKVKVFQPRSTILSNRPFDTTKGHILDHQLNVIELTPMTNPTSFSDSKTVFMGNIDVECITKFSTIDHCIVLVTLTDNGGGGQPMSMENYKKIAKQTHKNQKILWLDACRIFQNAAFIKAFQKQYNNFSLVEIVKQIVELADVVTISFKKIYSHSGGGILINKNSKILSDKIQTIDKKIKQNITADYGNGYSSYSGLTGEHMVEIISGLICATNQKIIARRIAQVGKLGYLLKKQYNLPVFWGGHALYIAADNILENVPLENCPAEYLNAILMNGLRIRGCGLGYIVYGKRQNGKVVSTNNLTMDSLRLAIPRNTYSTKQLLSKLSVFGRAYKEGIFKKAKGGLIPLQFQPNGFYHFGAMYEIVNKQQFKSIIDQLNGIRRQNSI